jgi:hypothetical protein
MRMNRGGIGFPASATASDFHPGPRGFFVRRPPHLSMGFHPPSSRPASFRVLRPARCPSCLAEPRDPAQRPKSASLGVPSLIATSTVGVHHSAGNPNPSVTFRPRRFSRPRRLAPPPAFAGLFHPAATSRVCPSGVCPSRGAVPGFPGRFMPSWRWAHPPATSECAPAFRALLPAASAVPPGTV